MKINTRMMLMICLIILQLFASSEEADNHHCSNTQSTVKMPHGHVFQPVPPVFEHHNHGYLPGNEGYQMMATRSLSPSHPFYKFSLPESIDMHKNNDKDDSDSDEDEDEFASPLNLYKDTHGYSYRTIEEENSFSNSHQRYHTVPTATESTRFQNKSKTNNMPDEPLDLTISSNKKNQTLVPDTIAYQSRRTAHHSQERYQSRSNKRPNRESHEPYQASSRNGTPYIHNLSHYNVNPFMFGSGMLPMNNPWLNGGHAGSINTGRFTGHFVLMKHPGY